MIENGWKRTRLFGVEKEEIDWLYHVRRFYIFGFYSNHIALYHFLLSSCCLEVEAYQTHKSLCPLVVTLWRYFTHSGLKQGCGVALALFSLVKP